VASLQNSRDLRVKHRNDRFYYSEAEGPFYKTTNRRGIGFCHPSDLRSTARIRSSWRVRGRGCLTSGTHGPAARAGQGVSDGAPERWPLTGGATMRSGPLVSGAGQALARMRTRADRRGPPVSATERGKGLDAAHSTDARDRGSIG
jgi:hypothetical protein